MPASVTKPTHIGRYEITGVIGRGGMGTVYKAVDPRIGRTVAIKVVTAAFGDDADLLGRFYREAKYTGSLQHPNIVTLYELGDQDGFPYLVMEYLEGQSLDLVISGRRVLSIPEKLDIMSQVCLGLSFAHARDIIHRDIKPANIVLLRDGTAKIVDFGIAHVGGKRLTRTGLVVGSVFYMSPEQVNSNVELDLRTDVFSAGIVLFQLLTGVLPFEGQDTGATLLKIVNDPPPPLANYLSSFPAELELVIQRALTKRREERYSSAEDFGFDLRRLQQQLLREQLSEYLQQAERASENRDWLGAKQILLQVLRIDPENPIGKQRLQTVQATLEGEKRKQEASQLRAQAEQALNNKDFDNALRTLDQALKLQPGESELNQLRESILRAQHAAEIYKSAVDRAEQALKRTSLDEAQKAIEEAREIQTPDERGRVVAERIAIALRERSKREEAAQRARQFAISVNLVEKAMADARMLLFLKQREDARAALESVAREVMQVPPELRARFEALRHQTDAEVTQKSAAQREEALNSDLPQPQQQSFKATVAFQSQGPPPPHISPDTNLSTGHVPAVPDSGESMLADNASAIPEELREFLPPARSNWFGPLAGVVIAVTVLAVGLYWISTRSNSDRASKHSSPTSSSAQEPTYVEINAEPWGTVTTITSLSGETVANPNEATPLRVPLPAGQYSISITGPSGQTRELQIDVPRDGGRSCFVVFAKPDIGQILNRK